MTHLPLLVWLAFAAPAIDGAKAYQSGTELIGKKQYKEAAAAFEQAAAAGFRPAISIYNAACAQARLGDKDAAFKLLDKVAQLGPPLAEQMKGDEDLAVLRDDPRWAKAVDAVDAGRWPCKHDPKSRDFDFWIGDWDVVDAKGNKLGQSHVDLELGSCVIHENWKGALGGNGQSFNVWDAGRKQWFQTWVDDSGGMHQYGGDLKDGAMRFSGELTTRQGQKSRLRMTFTPLPDGRVRQYLESSTDDGKTWVAGFDGYYVKKK